MATRTGCFLTLVGMLLSGAAGAQDVAKPPDPALIARAALGAVQAGDRVLGMGPGYRASFAEDGVSFGVPGGEGPSLHWRFESIRRGHVVSRPSSAKPIADKDTARYDRGAVTETYRMLQAGIEQSFVFAQRPEGSGDVVVRLAVATTLSAPQTHHDAVDEIVFVKAGEGGIAIGGVVGVDARGVRFPGAMRWENDGLEMLLPASFVEEAALPFVLDPLVGAPFSTGNVPALRAGFAEVAYDAANEVFLVGWSDANVGVDTFGRLVKPDGTLLGAVLCIECEQGRGGPVVSIANSRLPGQFVAWIASYFPVTVAAATGSVRVERTIPINVTWADTGGESAINGDHILVADFQNATRKVSVEQFLVGSSGSLTSLGRKELGDGGGALPAFVQVAKSSGAPRRHLVVWDYQGQIYGAVVDASFTVLDVFLVTLSPEMKDYAYTDGDGKQWLVAFRTPAGVKGVPVFWDSSAGRACVGSEVTIRAWPNAGVAGVAWMEGSYLISHGWDPGRVASTSVDPFTCLPCEGSTIHPVAGWVASQRSGDPTRGDIAFISTMGGFVQRFRADDGITTDLGGGCGSGGWSAASCARVGNAGFTLRLREARVGVPAFLVLGTQALNFDCGTCTLVPSPLTVVGAGLTDAHGNAEVLAPIPDQPSLKNQAFLEQWFTVGGTACSLGVEMSNALRVQLQ